MARGRAYSAKFKEKMVQRMLGPDGESLSALAATVGMPQSTLSNWVRDARKLASMSAKKANTPKTAAPTAERVPRRSKDWSPEERLRVVMESAALTDEERGVFLRREGLYQAQLDEWRQQVEEAAIAGMRPQRRKTKDARRIRELERELRRKDKALAETAALLVLSKKVEALWGDGGDDM